MSKVFIPHPVLVPTPDGRRWKFDIQRVADLYGTPTTVFDNSEIALTPDVAAVECAARFAELGFDPQIDYFLAGGDMTLYGIMMLVSATAFGITPKQLRHDRRYDKYNVIDSLMVDKEDGTYVSRS